LSCDDPDDSDDPGGPIDHGMLDAGAGPTSSASPIRPTEAATRKAAPRHRSVLNATQGLGSPTPIICVTRAARRLTARVARPYGSDKAAMTAQGRGRILRGPSGHLSMRTIARFA